MHKVLWSSKQPKLDITVFTILTVSRLDNLEAQCRSWPGPHSSAVYVPLLQTTGGKELTTASRRALEAASDDVRRTFDR